MLTPDLSESLTCTQSGTPLEAIAETTYTLTATDSNGDAATLLFTRSAMTDPMPTFGDASVNALAYTRRQEIAFLTFPQASRGDEPLTYALEVSLPSSDLDGDGEIDFDDFLIFADSFGTGG